MSKKHYFAASAILALALSRATAPATALAAEDSAKETSTAALHAGMAATSQDMQTTQMHLHHAVNCLGGAKDSNFDAAAGNPCQGQGDGAIPDTTDSAKKAQLQKAEDEAVAGLKETDISAAHKHAKAVQDALKASP